MIFKRNKKPEKGNTIIAQLIFKKMKELHLTEEQQKVFLFNLANELLTRLDLNN